MRKTFIWTGRLEGLSFLLLLGIAMPLKYIYGMPWATKGVGLAHGILFIAYLGMATRISDVENWSGRKLVLAMAFSLLPFGTFYFERKYLSDGQDTGAR